MKKNVLIIQYFPEVKKILMVMKLAIFLSLLGVVTVNANYSYAQNTKFTLTDFSHSLLGLFETIEKSSEFIFIYQDNMVDLNKEVHLNFEDKTVFDILDEAFKDTEITYEIIGRQVVIIRKEMPPVPAELKKEEKLKQETGTVRGRIIDENNLALPGANVIIEELLIGATSNVDGFYTILNVPVGTHEISVSYIGFNPEKETIVVDAGGTVVQDFALTAGLLIGEITIGHALQGQARAQSQQRASSNITNIVSAEQVGRFPDANIGDALKRLPGITVQYDQGEARFFALRGLETRLNSVMINGERMPSSSSTTRDVQLDIISADMIQTIEVNKTLTPDMDADAIGGSINLVTRSHPAGLRVSVTAGSGYNFLKQEPIWTGSIVVSNRFLNDKLGVNFNASIHDHHFGSDNIEAVWEEDSNGNLYTSDFQVRAYMLQRLRQNYSAGMDFKINDNHSLEVTGMYTWRNDWENRYRLRYRSFRETSRGWTTEIRRDNKMENTSDKNGARLEEQRTRYFSLLGDHLFAGKLKVDWSVSQGMASEKKPNEMTVSYRARNVLVIPNWSNTMRPVMTIPDSHFADLNNMKDGSDGYYWSMNALDGNRNYTDDKDFNARVDFQMPLVSSGDYRNSFKFGGRIRTKEKQRDNIAYEWDPVNQRTYDDMALANLINVSKDNFLAGNYRAGSFVDAAWAGGVNYGDAGTFETEYVEIDYMPANYFAKENIYAGYGMLNQNIGENLFVIAGVRVENTVIDYQGHEVNLVTETINKTQGEESYVNIFPALLVKYDIDPNTILRAAWTNTLARPNYYHLVPYRSINYDNNTLSAGNPDLNPTTSMNLDLMFERYLPKVGIVSAGVFYKNIDEFIFTYRILNYLDPVTGHTFDRLTQPRNGHGAKLYGFELSFQHQLYYLPGFLSGLGIFANYSYTHSEIEGLPDVSGRENEKMALPGTTKNAYNASLSYERGALQLRLSASYSAPYLLSGGVGVSPFYDIYYDKALHVDANGSFAFRRNMRVFFEANNLTNQPLREYQGEPGRLSVDEYYNVRVTFGFKVDL